MRNNMREYETYRPSHHVDKRKREKRTMSVCLRLDSEGSPNGIFRVAIDGPERIRIPFNLKKLLNLDSLSNTKAELLVEPGDITFEECFKFWDILFLLLSKFV